ncbi:MAG: hypothetical protein AAFS10_08460, partial [Myxococcota bacterium]
MERTTVIIEPHERAMVLRDKQPVAWAEPGRHTFWGWFSKVEVVRYNLDEGWAPLTPELSQLLPAGAGQELSVPAGHLAAITQDGRPWAVLAPGR